MMRALVILTLLFQVCTAQAGLFGNNKLDDSFAVKSIDGRQAVLEGTPKNLKVGDTLYSNKSPFQFTVTEIKGNTITVALPERHQLAEGHALLRYANDSIKKAIKTEARLKQALEE